MGFRACYSVFKLLVIFKLVEVTGFEPATRCLQGNRSPTELHPRVSRKTALVGRSSLLLYPARLLVFASMVLAPWAGSLPAPWRLVNYSLVTCTREGCVALSILLGPPSLSATYVD